MSAKCRQSPDGKHKWKDIVIVVEGDGTHWPHLQCEHCGITSWRGWDGIIAVERDEE